MHNKKFPLVIFLEFSKEFYLFSLKSNFLELVSTCLCDKMEQNPETGQNFDRTWHVAPEEWENYWGQTRTAVAFFPQFRFPDSEHFWN